MGFAEGFNAGSADKNRRETLKMAKENRDISLQQAGYKYNNGSLSRIPGSAADLEQTKIDEGLQLAKALQGKLAAQETDQAFEDFAHTGDAGYLQGALDKNPKLKASWAQRGVQLVSNLDFGNDTKLLSDVGLTESAYDTPEKQAIIKKNAYKYYDGKEWKVGLLSNAVAETGALPRMGNRRGEVILNNYNELRDLLGGPKSNAYTAEGHKYENELNAAAEKYNVPANLLASMMKVESNGNPNAVSPKGATGLMQLMPETAAELGVTDAKNPAQNIEAGAKYMSQLLKKYGGDTTLALAAYNAGMGNVDKYKGVPPFGETQKYVTSVLSNYTNSEAYYNRTPEPKLAMYDPTNAFGGTATDANAGLTTAFEDPKPAQQPSQPVQQPTQVASNSEMVNLDTGTVAQQSTPEDSIINTILEHRRSIANSERGTTNANVDGEIQNQAAKIQADVLQTVAKLNTEGKTAKQKDIDEAARSTDALLQDFGGEDQFYKTDFTDQKNFNKAYPNLIKIEKLEGVTYSENDKKEISNIRQLIALADPAKELTSDQTGLIDSTFANVKTYISDNVKGVEAKSAYFTIRNSIRNALYGSALTTAEIQSFNESFGTLGKQAGPVLAQFQVSLTQVQAKLESLNNMSNPYSAQVRLGADKEKLTNVINALQTRIDYIQGLTNEDGSSTTPNAKTAPTAKPTRQPLDAIFKGN